MTQKPTLYIDIDGVFFAHYAGWLNLRPRANSILKQWALDFDCRWLTCWPHDKITQWLCSTYAPELVRKIPSAKWRDRKTEGVDLSGDFFWIEDGIREDERQLLIDAGKLDRYIYCNPDGRDGLVRANQKLYAMRAIYDIEVLET